MAGKVRDKDRFKAARGRMPTLQFCRPIELHIDPSYQRDIRTGASEALIEKIARNWNWDLCQPLTVARRQSLTEQLFVIDGQHRLAAARRRGDIDQLPCVIVAYADAAEEAATFVALNRARRPLKAIDVFKAAVASGEKEALQVLALIEAAGLSLAPHETSAGWKAGQLANVGGIDRVLRSRGERVTGEALKVLAEAFPAQVLAYAGTIFPGIAHIVHEEFKAWGKFYADRREKMIAMLLRESQAVWRTRIHRAKGENLSLNLAQAAAVALAEAWAQASASAAQPAPLVLPPVASSAPVVAVTPKAGGGWCDQCDRKVTSWEAAACRSPFCKVKEAALPRTCPCLSASTGLRPSCALRCRRSLPGRSSMRSAAPFAMPSGTGRPLSPPRHRTRCPIQRPLPANCR